MRHLWDILWDIYIHIRSMRHLLFLPRHWNTGLVSSEVSLNSCGESGSLALAGNPSSDGIMIKIPYGVNILNQPHTPSFSIGLVVNKSDFIARSVETGFGDEC